MIENVASCEFGKSKKKRTHEECPMEKPTMSRNSKGRNSNYLAATEELLRNDITNWLLAAKPQRPVPENLMQLTAALDRAFRLCAAQVE